MLSQTVGAVMTWSPQCNTPSSGGRWMDEPASDHLWVTARDGDVVLTTTGDGTFMKE
jgi:hypothetical protein